MLIAILIKAIYASILWYWILGRYKQRGPFFSFSLIAVFFSLFVTLEVVTSWQFKEFTFHHMVMFPSLAIWLNLVIYLLITLVALAIHFTRETFRNERQKSALVENQLTTELNFLHAQINPHFLFNTLNNLFSVAQREKNEELAMAISRLSGLMRYMLYECRSHRVSLKREIERLEDFIGLCQMRFTKDEVDLKFEVVGNPEKVLIAPMILLPFVENAFKHGVKIEEKSPIEIRIEIDSVIRFTCFNHHAKKQGEPMESSGIGLENVQRRLSLLYPDSHELQIQDSEDSFEVRLKLEL